METWIDFTKFRPDSLSCRANQKLINVLFTISWILWSAFHQNTYLIIFLIFYNHLDSDRPDFFNNQKRTDHLHIIFLKKPLLLPSFFFFEYRKREEKKQGNIINSLSLSYIISSNL